MKRLVAAVATATLLPLGALTLTAAPASADCPYSGCVSTAPKTKVPDEVKAGKPAKVKFQIATTGNVKPKGTVIVVIKRDGKVVSKEELPYKGGALTYKSDGLKKGSYSVKIKFVPKDGSIYAPSSESHDFTVS